MQLRLSLGISRSLLAVCLRPLTLWVSLTAHCPAGNGSHVGRPSTNSLSIRSPARRHSDEPELDSPLHLVCMCKADDVVVARAPQASRRHTLTAGAQATSLPIAIPKTPRTRHMLQQSSKEEPQAIPSLESLGDEDLVPPHTLADNQVLPTASLLPALCQPWQQHLRSAR